MAKLEDEIKAIIASAHDKGAEAAAAEAPTPKVDLDDPTWPYVLPAVVSYGHILAFLVPVINGIEEALARLARELDARRDA
ncbi:MAG TPA: hypothetical protein VND88_07055 [Candidatus Acidoferrales bacterium]|nr:hypothetical protein [Candidatus Acidoferrales bacterium]